MVTSTQSGTRIDEIADDIYRIHTPVPPTVMPGGFSFNQYLVLGDGEPLLFHSGRRAMFPLLREALATVIDVRDLRYVGFSHVEADECSAVDPLLAIAPRAEPVTGLIGAMIDGADWFARPARGLGDGETLSLGGRALRWIETPHLPHGWQCGYLFDERTRTLLCGDLFTQPGADVPVLTTGDILGPSESLRRALDYFSHSTRARGHLERLATLAPETLACMHGSAWRGDGASLLRALADLLDDSRREAATDATL